MKKIILTIAIILFSTTTSFADEKKEVEVFINDLGNKIIKIADNKSYNVEQRRNQLIKLVDSVVDINWISKFVLGKHYRAASVEQKAKFKALYHDFMVHTYGPKFTGYSGEKFSITGVTQENNYYVAKCVFYPKDNAPNINLDFRVRKADSGLMVFDIVAEGVSLIETQRSEFGSVISQDGLDKFIADLAIRVEKLKTEKTKSPSQSKKTSGTVSKN